MNEIILILSLFIIYGSTLFAYRFFGKAGLFAFTVIATILANIEVLILVDAFGFEQTLGNVLFASTFLITDILSENEGRKEANKAVGLGIFTAVIMVVISQTWLLYTPSSNDWVSPCVHSIFSTTPRLLLASFIGFVVSQKLDVFLYHKWWEFTEKRFKDKNRFLWLRNNGSTLVSQLVNTLLFNLIAFFGVYETKTLISVIVFGYLVYFVTALLDTPIVYLARHLKKNGKIPE